MPTKEQIAKVCHDVNKAYCEALGDASQPIWENAPQWQKDSILMGVDLHTSNPNSKTSDSHNSWLEQKTKEGWKYGAIKNVELKEHPCFVSYEQLPKEQQAKDFIFKAIVNSLNNIAQSELPLTITEEYVDELCSNPDKIQYTLFPNTFHTVCCISLPNGSTVIGSSVCASSKIFDEAKGREYAFKDAREKVWQFEGYALCEKRFQAGLTK